jgi:hypothetical protein
MIKLLAILLCLLGLGQPLTVAQRLLSYFHESCVMSSCGSHYTECKNEDGCLENAAECINKCKDGKFCYLRCLSKKGLTLSQCVMDNSCLKAMA